MRKDIFDWFFNRDDPAPTCIIELLNDSSRASLSSRPCRSCDDDKPIPKTGQAIGPPPPPPTEIGDRIWEVDAETGTELLTGSEERAPKAGDTRTDRHSEREIDVLGVAESSEPSGGHTERRSGLDSSVC